MTEMLNGNDEIKSEYYDEIEREFRKEWQSEFGISIKDKSYAVFTLKEQIDRYYKNICFWERRAYIDTLPESGKELARIFLASNHKKELMDKVRTLRKEIQEGIWKRIREEGCKL